MKFAFVFINLFTIGTFADSVNIQCIPIQPCLYATEGLDVCVAKVSIYGSANGNGTEVIEVRPITPEHEILLSAKTYEIAFQSPKDQFHFQDESGDQFGRLESEVGGTYVGSITVDQDFEFQVTCTDKSITLE